MDVGEGGGAGLMVLPFAWVNLFTSSVQRTVPGIVSVLSPIRDGTRVPHDNRNLNRKTLQTASFSLQGMKLGVLSISVHSLL
jgi:hypothetical protein